MIRALALLAVTVALMSSARSFLSGPDAPIGASGVALAFGFLLLASLQAGRVFASLKLPRLTGYLITGLLCGPEVSGLLTERMVGSLGVVNGIAVGLIALAAGTELNLKRIRPRMRSILFMGFFAMPFAFFACAGLAMALTGRLPFMAGMGFTERIAVAATLGVVFASLSPSVALAILAETASEGPVSETVLGVVVLADIVIIVLFTLIHTAASGVFGAAGVESIDPVRTLLIEVFGSMGVGILVALITSFYVRRVKTKVPLFAIALCFVCAEVGSRLHLDVLIICLTAGLLLENVLSVGGEVVRRELAPASLPIFAVFFAGAGARLHMHDLALIWPLALLFAAVRGVSLFVGAYVGAVASRAEPVIRRWAVFGVLPQAGVSVGLAVLIERHFPTWGPGARALILSVITTNELVGPVLLRTALVRAGEAGRRKVGPGEGEH